GAVRGAERQRDLPGGVVRDAHVPHLAARDELAQRPDLLVECRLVVLKVQEEEVDVIRVQPPEASLELAGEMQTRAADTVWTRAGGDAGLGRDQHVRAPVAENAAEEGLGLAAGVDVGRVEKVDAVIERALD